MIIETIAAKITTENIDDFIKLFSKKLLDRYRPIGKLIIKTVEKIKKKKILIIYKGNVSIKFNEKSIEFKE